MDRQEWAAERPDGAKEAVETPEESQEPGAAEDAGPGEAPMELAAKEQPVEGGAEPAEGGATGEGRQTSVCFSGKTEEQTEAGKSVGREGPTERDPGAPEADWKRRAEDRALRAVFSEARAAAAAMGVPENRLDHVARISDLSGIEPEDEGSRARIADAVRAVLKELPELRGGVGTGRAATARRARRDAFERGFLGE